MYHAGSGAAGPPGSIQPGRPGPPAIEFPLSRHATFSLVARASGQDQAASMVGRTDRRTRGRGRWTTPPTATRSLGIAHHLLRVPAAPGTISYNDVAPSGSDLASPRRSELARWRAVHPTPPDPTLATAVQECGDPAPGRSTPATLPVRYHPRPVASSGSRPCQISSVSPSVAPKQRNEECRSAMTFSASATMPATVSSACIGS